MVNLTKRVTVSIQDRIRKATQQKPLAQDRFLRWLDEQPPEDREFIENAIRSGKPNANELAQILKDEGADITGNRLRDYRKTLLGQRVTS